MAQVIVDFDKLKFNLYEVLGVEKNASESKIKKAFRNLILNFHPDKNNDVEEDIYYHIITANQILSNKEYRDKYDNFLNKSVNTHDDLKRMFDKTIKNNAPDTKENAVKVFQSKFIELDNKHMASSDFNDKTTNRYEKMLKSRDVEINIPQENIKNTKDFNQKFQDRASNGGFSDQLIQVNENTQLSTYNVNDNYTSLDVAFDNLYIDGGGISTSKFTSLDSAFKLQPINTNYKETNIKNAMDTYKSNTTALSNTKFTKDKFDSW